MSHHVHVRDPITGKCPDCEIHGGHEKIVLRTGEDPHGGGGGWRTIRAPLMLTGGPKHPSRSPSPHYANHAPYIYETPPTPSYQDFHKPEPVARAGDGNPIYIQIQPPAAAPAPAPPPAPVKRTHTREIQSQTDEKPKTPPPVFVVNLPESRSRTPTPPPPQPAPTPQPQVIYVNVPEKERPRTPKPAPPPPPPPPPPPQVVYVERPPKKKVEVVAPIRTRPEPPATTTTYYRAPTRTVHQYTPRSYGRAGSKALDPTGRRRCLCCCLVGSLLALLLGGAIMGIVMWSQNQNYLEAIPQPRNFWIVPNLTDCNIDPTAVGPTTTVAGCAKTATVTAKTDFTVPTTLPSVTQAGADLKSTLVFIWSFLLLILYILKIV